MERRIGFLLLFLLSATALVGCESAQQSEAAKEVKMETVGTIVLELYPDKAPKTVEQITRLIREGFYEGQRVHRVDAGADQKTPWVVQWGDPQSKRPAWRHLPVGTQGSGKQLPFEENDLTMERGVLAMASTGEKVGGDSQMFLIGAGADQGTLEFLQGKYCIFGKAVEGLDVIEKIQRGDVLSMKIVAEEEGKPIRVEMHVTREVG